jgi:hypothetical protein
MIEILILSFLFEMLLILINILLKAVCNSIHFYPDIDADESNNIIK